MIVNGEARHTYSINHGGGWISESVMRVIGRLDEGVRAQWDEVRHAAALLVAGLAAFRRSKAMPTGVKPSWFHTILKGAPLAGSIWFAFCARSR